MLHHLRPTLTPQVLATLACEFIVFNGIFIAFHRIEILKESGNMDLAVLAYLFYAFFFVFDNVVLQFSLWSFGLYLQGNVTSPRKVLRCVSGAILFTMVVTLPVYWLFGFVEDLPVRFPLYQPVFLLLGFGILLGTERLLLLRPLQGTARLAPSKG